MPRRMTEIEKASVSNPGAPTTTPAILQGIPIVTTGTDWNNEGGRVYLVFLAPLRAVIEVQR